MDECDHYHLVRRGGFCRVCGRTFKGSFLDVPTTSKKQRDREDREERLALDVWLKEMFPG